MKLAHLSDLHLGKRVNGFSMLEDQSYILDRIMEILKSERPDALLIAGDVYDKSIPSAEAVELLDSFLVRLSREGIATYLISGNHDSAERLAFGHELMERSGIHLSPVYDGRVSPVTLEDEYGKVTFYPLPFLKAASARRFFPEAQITSDEDAVSAAIAAMQINPKERNILIAHQFVTGASRCKSEESAVGGSDNVSAQVFDCFDYVALGHLHGPQTINGNLRYSGSPLKYSFSECSHEKSVTIVTLKEKGNLTIETRPLVPLRDMKQLRGSYEEVTALSFYKDQPWKTDYLRITLIDEEDVPQAMGRLQVIYPNLMRLDYDNRRTRAQLPEMGSTEAPRSPMELFSELYEMQNGTPMTEAQRLFLEELMGRIQEDML